jgi:predicted dienelactone hydrolase
MLGGLLLSQSAFSQENRIDQVGPDAPELASFGEFDIGVRTLNLLDEGRIDVLNTPRGGETVLYNRGLTIEVWYPAQLDSGQQRAGSYRAITRNPDIVATLNGRAVRDANPLAVEMAFPLIIVSHGYPGNRFLMSHVGESLASKGYVVASIDHRESTYDDQQSIMSTFYHRPLDQRFVLDSLATLSNHGDSFLFELVDADSTGIVGFSMGGYGLLNNLGAGFSEAMIENLMAPPNGLLAEHTFRNPDYQSNLDPRIKAGFAVAPWGMNSGFFTEEVLTGIETPTFYLAGSVDETAGYEEGTRAIFESAINSDRYLLTFEGAGHSAGAPIPPPVELLDVDDPRVNHYTDAVWENVEMNNIMDHFITAFFDHYLKTNEGSLEYLPRDQGGAESFADAKNWKGFAAENTKGLSLEFLNSGN